MFSNLKRMVEEKRFSSIIFIFDELGQDEIKFQRMGEEYLIRFTTTEAFEEHQFTKEKFDGYLETLLKKILYKGDYKILNTIKGTTVCSFRVKKINKIEVK